MAPFHCPNGAGHIRQPINTVGAIHESPGQFARIGDHVRCPLCKSRRTSFPSPLSLRGPSGRGNPHPQQCGALPVPHRGRKENGLPRRSAPRNDGGGRWLVLLLCLGGGPTQSAETMPPALQKTPRISHEIRGILIHSALSPQNSALKLSSGEPH